VSFHIGAYCTYRWWHRCQDDPKRLPCQRTGRDHQGVLISCGWTQSSAIWEPTTSHWMKHSTWHTTVLCGGWCLHMVLHTPSGAYQKRRRRLCYVCRTVHVPGKLHRGCVCGVVSRWMTYLLMLESQCIESSWLSSLVWWWMKKGQGQATGASQRFEFPSLHWHHWLSDKKGILQSVKNLENNTIQYNTIQMYWLKWHCHASVAGALYKN